MPTSVKELLDRMDELDTTPVDTDGAFMIYGGPGQGKTVLSLKVAQAIRSGEGQIAYCDSGQGWVSLKNHPELLEGVSRFSVKSYDDLVGMAVGLQTRQLLADPVVVVIDEGSTIYDNLLDTILRQRLTTPANDEPREVPQWEDYRPAGELFKKGIQRFIDIEGLHVIIVAHTKEEVIRQKPKVVALRPEFSPGLNTKIQKLMHVTAHVKAEITGTANAPVYKRSVQSHPTTLVWAKSRVGHMPLYTDFDTFAETLADWVYSEDFEDDQRAPEPEAALTPDVIPPMEGLSLSNDPIEDGDDDEEDDEPAYVGE